MKTLLMVLRLIFGAWLVKNGLDHFFIHAIPLPTGTQPLAVQLMAAVIHSGLIDLVMGIQLVAGALILAGLFVPLALCVVMPLSVCIAYWAVILEREPLGALVALVAVALNALLCLAHLRSYRGVLEPWSLAAGEEQDGSFDRTFAIRPGSTSPREFALALIPLLAAFAFYHQFIFGPYKMMGYMVLAVPSAVLVLRLVRGLVRKTGQAGQVNSPIRRV